MSKLTGRIIDERYASINKENSFYQEQNLKINTINIYNNYNSEKEILYYADKNTGKLKMKTTHLLNK